MFRKNDEEKINGMIKIVSGFQCASFFCKGFKVKKKKNTKNSLRIYTMSVSGKKKRIIETNQFCFEEKK